ncbi:19251_t:CDS:2 [Cetraspora pellucida]|uniref:19251_t:CDS:1 n=1 Tax=Cetraspora pellucida TaxID=1433469 RepID=A0A9N9HV54_9GLOM|nr:19251_t:CDS:2 [Cetraspora pellucida]
MSRHFPDYDNHRVCLLPFPSFTQFIEKKRDLGVYVSGSLFALGWWFFIDAVVLSNTIDNDTQPAIGFEDWMCGISSTLGMLIVNSIDKSRLTADNFSYTGSGIATKARFFLFVGFALMAGGLAGSVTILILKHIVPEAGQPYIYFGIEEFCGALGCTKRRT